ncbi:PIR Superfamily Protein [Plasmodium ovale wallikeri]|uniref:PIR Superfamily Protein n=1 Tax=Plasmodium ovale wallikeri TaxID=864142 RepID=A0A1A9AJF5_PLAOA|nr:PIR Superfamily Protein [Plasmodium ovale wallikeri]SBT58251.1 PIR Superfamily Protein [Plasmodium ovale wallikeri]
MLSTKKTIYNVANSFEIYKREIDNNHSEDGSRIIEDCDKFISPYLHENESANICERAVLYLNSLKANAVSDYIDQGCRYLCIWINNNVIENKKSPINVINLFNEFLRKFEEYDGDYKFKDYLKQFSTDMLENLMKLFELYSKFNINNKEISSCNNCDCVKASADLYNKFADECYAGDDNDFCDELENFKQTYENYMKTSSCPETIPQILPPIKRHNIGATVSIPFAIILVISFFLFILYKFTPFGLHVSSLLNRKKTIYNDLEQDTNEFIFNSKKLDINSENKKYSLSYHSVE